MPVVEFVRHGNYEDGLTADAGDTIGKAWIVKNIGSTPLPSNIAVSVRRKRSGPLFTNLLQLVEEGHATPPIPVRCLDGLLPGQEAEITVPINTPPYGGQFQRRYILQSPSFGSFCPLNINIFVIADGQAMESVPYHLLHSHFPSMWGWKPRCKLHQLRLLQRHFPLV